MYRHLHGVRFGSGCEKHLKNGNKVVGNLAEYFARNRYQAQWQIGDRVQGRWNGIPFRGTVGNDTVISEVEGPRVSVHLDLPIRYKDTNHNIIIVKPKELKEFR